MIVSHAGRIIDSHHDLVFTFAWFRSTQPDLIFTKAASYVRNDLMNDRNNEWSKYWWRQIRLPFSYWVAFLFYNLLLTWPLASVLIWDEVVRWAVAREVESRIDTDATLSPLLRSTWITIQWLQIWSSMRKMELTSTSDSAETDFKWSSISFRREKTCSGVNDMNSDDGSQSRSKRIRRFKRNSAHKINKSAHCSCGWMMKEDHGLLLLHLRHDKIYHLPSYHLYHHP